MTSRSPCLPTSMEPCCSERPRAAAALMVAAASTSGMVMCRVTQAKCITNGCMEGYKKGVEEGVRGREEISKQEGVRGGEEEGNKRNGEKSEHT